MSAGGSSPCCFLCVASMRGGAAWPAPDTMGAEGRSSLQGSTEEFLRDSQKPDFGHMPTPSQDGERAIGTSAKHLSSLNPNSSENRDNHRPHLTKLL